jgi:multisubunit Na+/H+ antiporter MnhC subunit
LRCSAAALAAGKKQKAQFVAIRLPLYPLSVDVVRSGVQVLFCDLPRGQHVPPVHRRAMMIDEITDPIVVALAIVTAVIVIYVSLLCLRVQVEREGRRRGRTKPQMQKSHRWRAARSPSWRRQLRDYLSGRWR